MVTQGNFHQALPCAGKVVYLFYREQLATSYDLPHKQKIADFGMPIAEFLNRNSELNFSRSAFRTRHSAFHLSPSIFFVPHSAFRTWQSAFESFPGQGDDKSASLPKLAFDDYLAVVTVHNMFDQR
jgi:hypothetical protein